MKVLAIIPAYNEEDSILGLIKELEASKACCDYIIINDCSRDATGRILDEHHLHHLDLPVNTGLQGAVQTGYKYAYYNGYDAAFQLDGDGQHRVEYIQPLIDELNKGYDIVIGSRFVNKKRNHSLRMVGSRLITFAIKLTTGKTISDPTSGMRIMNREMLKDFAFELNRKPEPDTIAFQIKRGYRVTEIPVEMRERETGRSTYAGLWHSVKYMFCVITTILFLN